MDLEKKYQEVKVLTADLEQQLSDPDVMADMDKFIAVNKSYSELMPLNKTLKSYFDAQGSLAEAKRILKEEKDPEWVEMAELEVDELEPKLEQLEQEIKVLLLPKDPNDNKNAVLELRAGTGGDEASLFVGDLLKMYLRYAEKKGLRTEIMDVQEGTAGGYKEVIVNVTGEQAYGIFKFESGVHRVQRVPQTETQGRVHTSAATVAVLPEAEEVDVQIDMNEVKKETYCSSGPGGQSVNTTYSAVRLTHLPTGVVAQCQDQKSQIKNFEKALKVLRSRVFDIEWAKQNEEITSQRRSMVSTGDRSAKIRTYNFPQGRVTDHRIGLTVYDLSNVLNGDLDKFTEELQLADQAEKMKEHE
jgi:peptide chain release factor 1